MAKLVYNSKALGFTILNDNVKFVLIAPPEGLDPWEGCHPQIMTSTTNNGIHEFSLRFLIEKL